MVWFFLLISLSCFAPLRWFQPATLLALVALLVCLCSFPPAAMLVLAALSVRFCSFPPALLALAALLACLCSFPPATLLAFAALLAFSSCYVIGARCVARPRVGED